MSTEDFFRCPEFLAAERVTSTLQIFGSHGDLLLAPVIVRPIPGSEKTDASSPYGYPGYGGRVDLTLDQAAVDWSPTGLVSVFLRGELERRRLKPTTLRARVWVHDPHRPATIADLHKRHVRRNQRLGYEVTSIAGPLVSSASLEAFYGVYTETMVRTRAHQRYFFSVEYMKQILASSLSWLFLARDPAGSIVAGAVTVVSGGWLHYFLGGTSDSHLAYSPFKNIMVAMMDLAATLGIALNLGAGLAPGDGLDIFKRGFANDDACFYTNDVIVDQSAYEQLSSGHSREANYFPAYRQETER